MEEEFKEKTVVLEVVLYEECGTIASDLNYYEFEKGTSLKGEPTVVLPWYIEGVKAKDYDEKFWLDSLVEGIDVFLHIEKVFKDVKKLIIRVLMEPSQTLSNLSFYSGDNIEQFLKKEFTDEEFQKIKIELM